MSHMTDAEYQRVVEELKARKSHRGDDETIQTLYSISTSLGLACIASRASRAGQRNTSERADGLSARVKALTVWQHTQSLADVVHTIAKRLSTEEGVPDTLDHDLARIDAELGMAERRLK